MWELVQLARHAHPTISLWATDLLKGDLLEYGGDPLLDFGITNFLDRIAFKNPKSQDKVERFRQRMAQFEKPINMIEVGENVEHRQEEEYMHKYMEMKPRKIKKEKDLVENSDGEMEDPDLEAFIDKEFDAKMKSLTQGNNPGEDEDESLDIDYSDNDEDAEDDVAESDGDFFDGEDLDDVALEG